MKKFTAFLLLIVAVLSLASCSKKPGGSSDILSPDQIDTSKEVKVSFYHAMGQANQEVIAHIADNFSKDMKDKYGVTVTVEQTSSGDYTTLRKTLASAISAGDQPTIAQTYPDHVALYLEGEAVRALDDYVEHEEYGLDGSKEDNYGYIDMFWAEGRIYDKEKTLYSIPFNKSTEVIYYNMEIFQKYNWSVPKTWDDIVTICEAWKTTTEYQNIIKAGKKAAGLGIDSEANLFITLTQQWGGEYTGFDANGNGVYLFDNPKSKAALEWLVDQYNKNNIVSTTYFGTNYCSDAFKAGQCPMTIGSSAGASYNITTDASFTTGVAEYPQVKGAKEEDKKVIQQGTNVTLFECEDPQEELFGWLFIKYLTNFESALYWTVNTAYFPIRKDVEKCAEYVDYVSQIIKDDEGNPQLDANGNPVKDYDPSKEVCIVGLGQQKYFYTSEAFPGSSKCRDEVELIIKEILYNQAEYTIEKAIKDALNILKNN